MGTPAPHIALEQAGRSFADPHGGERRALGPVTLSFAPGSTVAVVGPSGAGKSTLLRLVVGALAASAGEVRIDGVDVGRMSARALRRHRRRAALIDQELLVLPKLSVHHNVVAGLAASWPWYRVAAAALWPPARAPVRALLARLELAERQWDPAEALSGGQKQRVAVARGLIRQPALICADEPTAALDPATAEQVLSLMAEEARARAAPLIVGTHRLSQVVDKVDRVIGLRAGEVVLDAAADAVSEADLDSLYEGSRERA
ncbi:MAG: phosphonate ABC transporter ATP-binding protein [Haliangiales bacterium]